MSECYNYISFVILLMTLSFADRVARVANSQSGVRMSPSSFLVEPFRDDSDDDRGYISADITRGLTRGLGRIPSSSVIAQESAIVLGRQALTPIEVGHKLGVDFVLRGAALMREKHVRVTAALLSTQDGHQLWGETFERPFVQLRAVEAEIVARVALASGTALPSETKQRDALTEYDTDTLTALLRANAILTMPQTNQTLAAAGGLYTAVLRASPHDADALAGMAAIRLATALTSAHSATADALECQRLIDQVLALEPQNGQALSLLGALRRATGKRAEALTAYQAAAAANHNDASAHGQIGRLEIDLGKPEDALPAIEQALRLSPVDPQRALWYTVAGLAKLHLSAPGEAQEWLAKAVDAGPHFVTALVFLAAAQQIDGKDTDARRTIEAALAMSPALSISRVEGQFAPEGSRLRDSWVRILDALQRAGLPD